MQTKTPEQINELLRVARKMSNEAVAAILTENQKKPRNIRKIEEIKTVMTIPNATVIALEWVLSPPDNQPVKHFFALQ